MHFETAEVSLLGDREENQDRAAIRSDGGSVLLIVADGMGGHWGGALAAEVAVHSLCTSFDHRNGALAPHEFLRSALETAHDAVVALGDRNGFGSRPRATCAVCMVQDERASWAHVGDSRVYFARKRTVMVRTRDHTPIESLLQEGLIGEDEIVGHPMRHYVEYCLGGVAERPLITTSEPVSLAAGDLLLVCSDGLWSGLSEEEIGAGPGEDDVLPDWLTRMASRAVRVGTPHSDNTTAVALRVLAD